ncbi:MAG: hypothetical protein ACREQQ_07470, partial [Candidatus Binatia bacterium]
MIASTLAETPELPYESARAVRVEAAKRLFSGEVVDRFERGMFETDEAADHLVEAFADLPPGLGWRLLDESLAAGSPRVAGAPGALEALLAPLFHPPRWLDLERVEAGAAIWWRFIP